MEIMAQLRGSLICSESESWRFTWMKVGECLFELTLDSLVGLRPEVKDHQQEIEEVVSEMKILACVRAAQSLHSVAYRL